MEAQFEERRHGWVDAIIHQWIDEHKDVFGIQRQVTDALAVEVAKMTEKLADTSQMDVPQVLLLKLDRLTDFMEQHYRLQASALNKLVKISGSHTSWSYDLRVDLRESAMAPIRAGKDESETGVWRGVAQVAIGVPLFFIPVLGPALGGGNIGYGVVDAVREYRKVERLKKLEGFPELLRFAVVYTHLVSASNALRSFLKKQGWRRKTFLLVCERKNRKIDLSLALQRRARGESDEFLSLKAIVQARDDTK